MAFDTSGHASDAIETWRMIKDPEGTAGALANADMDQATFREFLSNLALEDYDADTVFAELRGFGSTVSQSRAVDWYVARMNEQDEREEREREEYEEDAAEIARVKGLADRMAMWACTNCSYSNPGNAPTCAACLQQRPPVFNYAPTYAPSNAFGSLGLEWTCNSCLGSNRDHALSCMNCGCPRTGRPVPPSNPYATITCEECEYPIPAFNDGACPSCGSAVTVPGGFSGRTRDFRVSLCMDHSAVVRVPPGNSYNPQPFPVKQPAPTSEGFSFSLGKAAPKKPAPSTTTARLEASAEGSKGASPSLKVADAAQAPAPAPAPEASLSVVVAKLEELGRVQQAAVDRLAGPLERMAAAQEAQVRTRDWPLRVVIVPAFCC
jgi:ribosomal protein L12E/L44/L45/RPP1/RPP2